MGFLDVCENPEARSPADNTAPPLLLVVQSDFVEVHSLRVVVPLQRVERVEDPIRDLMPTLDVQGEPFVMMTPLIAGIPISAIGRKVESLLREQHRIRRAIDILTGDL